MPLYSFGDKELRCLVLQKGCKTVKEALTFAVRMEAINASANTDNVITFNKDENRTAHCHVTESATNNDQIQQMNQQISELRNELQSCKSRNTYQSRDYQQQPPQQFTRPTQRNDYFQN